MKFKLPYEEHERVQVTFSKPSLTQQELKEECDINNILKKFHVSGVLTHVNPRKGDYGDFMGVDDYHTALLKINEARGLFEALPAKVRTRFRNDPAEFLSFVENPENREEMVKLGLVEPKVEADLPKKVEGASKDVPKV